MTTLFPFVFPMSDFITFPGIVIIVVADIVLYSSPLISEDFNSTVNSLLSFEILIRSGVMLDLILHLRRPPCGVMSSAFVFTRNLFVAAARVLNSSQVLSNFCIEPVLSSTMISVCALPSSLNSNFASMRHAVRSKVRAARAVRQRDDVVVLRCGRPLRCGRLPFRGDFLGPGGVCAGASPAFARFLRPRRGPLELSSGDELPSAASAGEWGCAM